MKNLTYRQGSLISLDVERASDTAISATLLYNGPIADQITELYVNGVAHFEFSLDDVGEYEYQINESYESGPPDIYPNMDNCDGDCDLPKITICEALPEGS